MAPLDGLGGAVAATVIICAVSCVLRAEAQSIGLPEVTVTAPPVTPSSKKWNPYSSNPRVEEDKWREIPCSGSRISSAAAAACRTGPPLGHEGILVVSDTGNLIIEADAVVVDPYFVSAIGSQHKGCYAQAHFSDLREDFPDMNQMTRRGNAWRNFVEDGDLSTMEFALGSSNCRAVEKRGPPWRGGHVYVIHASVCRKDGRTVEATDIDFVLGSLQVRQYEPRGNLRPPAQ